jgi:hypothetical protein
MTVYRDHARRELFYFLPGKLVLPTLPDGAPDLSFLILRHVGRSATGDSGTISVRSYLTINVRFASQAAAARLAESELRRTIPGARLVPLPIRKTQCRLAVALVDDAATKVYLDGRVEADPGDSSRMAPTTTAGAFAQKSILIAPDADTAQALWKVFSAGQAPLSLTCTLLAPAYDEPPEDKEPPPPLRPVYSDSLPIVADFARWPERLARIELGTTAPKEYAFLEVLCFDFAAETPAPLFSRTVEVEATAALGGVLRRRISFPASAPDRCVARLRFDAPVALDRPYRYRVRDTTRSGETHTGPWLPGKPWSIAIDITGPSSTDPIREEPKP